MTDEERKLLYAASNVLLRLASNYYSYADYQIINEQTKNELDNFYELAREYFAKEIKEDIQQNKTDETRPTD